jgi:hypothetical protein
MLLEAEALEVLHLVLLAADRLDAVGCQRQAEDRQPTIADPEGAKAELDAIGHLGEAQLLTIGGRHRGGW